MRYLFLVSILIFTGCYESHNKMVSTGKKPPTFFRLIDKQFMDEFEFDTERFSFKFPTSKEKDFIERGGWRGMSLRDGKTISFGFKKGSVYNISISTNHKASEYGEIDRAIESRDLAYLEMIKKKYNYGDTKLYYETHGQENYGCRVIESVDKFNRYTISFGCRKSNIEKTKSRRVAITLTYNKPINPILAQEYTYEDLKERAKRMLDSLVIKGDW